MIHNALTGETMLLDRTVPWRILLVEDDTAMRTLVEDDTAVRDERADATQRSYRRDAAKALAA